MAPALVRSPTITDDAFPTDEPPLVGPLLVVYPVAGEQAESRGEALLDHFAPRGHFALRGQGRLRFGVKPRDVVLHRDDRQIHGALLVERLPPGLPEPRP